MAISRQFFLYWKILKGYLMRLGFNIILKTLRVKTILCVASGRQKMLFFDLRLLIFCNQEIMFSFNLEFFLEWLRILNQDSNRFFLRVKGTSKNRRERPQFQLRSDRRTGVRRASQAENATRSRFLERAWKCAPVSNGRRVVRVMEDDSAGMALAQGSRPIVRTLCKVLGYISDMFYA